MSKKLCPLCDSPLIKKKEWVFAGGSQHKVKVYRCTNKSSCGYKFTGKM